MQSKRQPPWAFAVMIGLLVIALPGCPVPSSLVVLVRDSTSLDALTNARVCIAPGGYAVTSNLDGAYVFNALAPGEYTLGVVAEGYHASEITVTVSPGQVAPLIADMTRLQPGEVETRDPCAGATLPPVPIRGCGCFME